ncbi:uncharacterized protein LOC129218946 [Uloborus diversus]|uniref:uncharacterized protein LOC129218946 n=1 Tax=Uloborus diversus TaxID=327109 RepID=UPI00240A63AD|nr:uncharacterized protein LOC129218946 [Uloborus diversus]
MEGADRAQIIASRGRIKASVTRLENTFNDINTKNEVLIRIQRLDTLFTEFEKLDVLLDDKDSEIAEFEEKYFRLKAQYQNKIESFHVPSQIREVQINGGGSTVTQNAETNLSNFRLPKLNITPFSGNFNDWINFKDLYLVTVHNQDSLSNVQKFQYLKGLLTDEPASLIKHIPLSNASYLEAWENLLDRYDKKKKIVQSLIGTFLEQKGISRANDTNLKNFMDTSDEIIRGLKALGEEALSRDPWLIYLMLQKLDTESRRLWSSETANVDFPSLKSFFDFLKTRCSSLELIMNNELKKVEPMKNNVGIKNRSDVRITKNCIKCHGVHPLFKCVKFKSMDFTGRKNFVKRNQLCYLCLNVHRVKDCPNSHLKCMLCQAKHNTLLHENIKGNTASVSEYLVEKKRFPTTVEENDNPRESFSPDCELDSNNVNRGVISSTSVNNTRSVSFLPTAQVVVQDSSGKSYTFRALLDSGSECSFISENLMNVLRLRRKNDRISLTGIAEVSAGQTRGSVMLDIGSKFSNERIEVKAYILNKLTAQLPSEFLDLKDLDYIKAINNLADKEFMRPQPIDIILGSDCFFTIMRNGKIVGSKNEPIAQNTMFGWVIAGRILRSDISSPIAHSHFINVEENTNIDAILQKFWQTEELPVKKRLLSEEEEFCETHFQTTFKINDQGRFVVKLPIYKDKSFFMIDYEKLGHMTRAETSSDFINSDTYFLPHHAVIKNDSVPTKLRVVFDGSCKPPDSHSLNSILAVGQTVQPALFSILMRFRMNRIAFSADIQQMYRQILVDFADQDLQRIVWRESESSPISEFRLCTLTYGTSAAPFLATRVLHQIGLDIENEDPTVSSIIKNSFYIDDLMSGSNSNEEAIATIKTLSEVLEARGFHLRKWRSNSPQVLSDSLPTSPKEVQNLEIHPDECSKALGLTWDSLNDCFVFKVNFKFEGNITKRTFLSQSAKLFDPLGFLSPCTISIKIFYQQLWLLKLDWDSPLPQELATKWEAFQRNFEQVCYIRIPRWIQTTNKNIILHGFCDASECAYAAVIYAVQPRSDEESEVIILTSKSKVAPLKSVSIPRLELNGALLLARLYSSTKSIFSDCDISFHAWTDSQVVLTWLSSPPRNWKPYVSNRTSEILDLVPVKSWSFVPTKENPADIVSRGLAPKYLPDCTIWWKGPSWLKLTEESWPNQLHRAKNSETVLKEKKNFKFSFNTSVNCSIIDNLFQKFSSFSKIIDILAFCFRFISNCRMRNRKRKPGILSNDKPLPLTTSERKQAGKVVISYIQSAYFSDEINCIKNDKSLPCKSLLLSLCPFIDKDGLIRVGGRLQNSQLPFSAKHPIILPAQHKISSLLVKHFHASTTLLLGILRQQYWIIGARKIIKKCIHNCVICCRYRYSVSKQIMGNLPVDRVTLTKPFSVCGVDYVGPVSILKHRGRGAKTTKGYIALFVCFATKALHLELVSDMTSETFIAALRRFCSRRGAPKHIHSDNGDIVLIREDNVPPSIWPLGKIIATHSGKDGVNKHVVASSNNNKLTVISMTTDDFRGFPAGQSQWKLKSMSRPYIEDIVKVAFR